MVIAVTSAIWTRDTLVEEKWVMSDKYDGLDGSWVISVDSWSTLVLPVFNISYSFSNGSQSGSNMAKYC